MSERKKPNRKTVIKETTTITKDEAGKVVNTISETESSIPTEPDFVKLYIEDISRLSCLRGSASNVLYELLKRMTYENEIALTKRIRKEIAERLSIKQGTFDNQLSAIVRSGIMKSLGINDYVVNPNFFAKGKWKHIYKQRVEFLNLTIKYSADGTKQITSEIEMLYDHKNDPFAISE